MITKEAVLDAIKHIKTSQETGGIVSAGVAVDVEIQDHNVTVVLRLSEPAAEVRNRLKEEVRKAVKSIAEVEGVNISIMSTSPARQSAEASRMRTSGPSPRELAVRYIIPVASGKGGVGKSTVSANLAIALAQKGARVGLMDADVYGPSIPTLMGVDAQPAQREGRIVPLERYGIKLISMGFFLPKGEAVIWRGPMLHKAVDQFLGTVDWGELDYLIVDLPPGTGDIQLSLCQTIPLTGAVVVSTPQDLAFSVAEKAIAMFDKLRTPILGLVENMSGYVCSHCGHRDEIFGHGGARTRADARDIPFLGEIPLTTDIRTGSDRGEPVVVRQPDSAAGRAFTMLAERLEAELAGRERGERRDTRPEPKEIVQPDASHVRISWKDGHESVYSTFALRAACSCAQCVDENTGKRMLREDAIAKDITVRSIEKTGSYAVVFRWSDGHATGIYTFDYLRSLCPCGACKDALPQTAHTAS